MSVVACTKKFLGFETCFGGQSPGRKFEPLWNQWRPCRRKIVVS